MSSDFVVHDRRLFGKDGDLRNDRPAAEDQAAAATPGEAPSGDPGPARPDLPPANLASLLIGLATSAFMHLGAGPEGGDSKGEADLPAAKHAIDLLAVLEAKTRGNLEEEEEALLKTLLYDLRIQYVQAKAK